MKKSATTKKKKVNLIALCDELSKLRCAIQIMFITRPTDPRAMERLKFFTAGALHIFKRKYFLWPDFDLKNSQNNFSGSFALVVLQSHDVDEFNKCPTLPDVQISLLFTRETP